MLVPNSAEDACLLLLLFFIDTETENNLKLAFQAFKGQTCIEFVPRSDESNYIQFTDGDG